MKYGWLRLLLLVFALLAVGAGAEEGPAGTPADMCMPEENVFVFAGQDALLVLEDGALTGTLPCPDVRFCAALDGEVYALCAAGQSARVLRYGREGVLLEEIDLGAPGAFCRFAVCRGSLCGIVQDERSWELALFTYDLRTEEARLWEEYPDAVDLAAEGDRILLRCRWGMEEALLLLGPDGRGPLVVCAGPARGRPLLIPGEEACAVLTAEGVAYIDWAGESGRSRTYDIGGMEMKADLAAADGSGVFLYDPERDAMLHIPLEALRGAGSEMLTVAMLAPDADPYLQDVLKLFRESRPEYSVEERVFVGLEDMQLELMSGASDVDILLLNQGLYPTVARSGVFLDLRQLEPVRALEEDAALLDWPFHMAESRDGRLLMVPATGSVAAWTADGELFSRLGLPLPEEGWTWDDLVALGRRAKEADPDVYIVNSFALQELLSQYALGHADPAGGALDADSEALARALEIARTLCAEDMVQMDAYAGPTLFVEHSVLLQDKGGSGRRYLTLPRLAEGDAPLAEYDGCLMGVCSRSDDIPAAAELISLYYRAALEGAVPRGQYYYPLYYSDPAVNAGCGLPCAGAETLAGLQAVCAHARPLSGVGNLLGESYRYLLEYALGDAGLEETVRRIHSEIDIRLSE